MCNDSLIYLLCPWYSYRQLEVSDLTFFEIRAGKVAWVW
jgi:hypothetical protein